MEFQGEGESHLTSAGTCDKNRLQFNGRPWENIIPDCVTVASDFSHCLLVGQCRDACQWCKQASK